MPGARKQARRRQVRFTLHESMGEVFLWFEKLPPGTATNREIEYLLRLGVTTAQNLRQPPRPYDGAGQPVAATATDRQQIDGRPAPMARHDEGWSLTVADVSQA